MEVQSFITALSNELKQELSLDGNNSLILTIDEIPLLIQWRPELNLFHLQMDIGEVSAMGGRNILAELLEANFLAIETAGAFISYNSTIAHAFLENSVFVQGLLVEDFLKEIENFIYVVDAWRVKLDELNKKVETQAIKDIKATAQSWNNSADAHTQGTQDFIKI